MSNIQGRVKHETLNELFKMGDLNHPDTITKEITDTMKTFNKRMRDATEKPKSFSFFKQDKNHYKDFKSAGEFIQALRNGTISSVSPFMEDDYFIDLWFKISDVRTVLHVKCVAKNCQSNNVMADKNSLLSLQRVINNKQEYLDL